MAVHVCCPRGRLHGFWNELWSASCLGRRTPDPMVTGKLLMDLTLIVHQYLGQWSNRCRFILTRVYGIQLWQMHFSGAQSVDLV